MLFFFFLIINLPALAVLVVHLFLGIERGKLCTDISGHCTHSVYGQSAPLKTAY